MNDDNQNVAEIETIEALPGLMEDANEVATEAQPELDLGITEEGEQPVGQEALDPESGQLDLQSNDPDWMVKRLKRQRRKIDEEHQRDIQQLSAENAQMRANLNIQPTPAYNQQPMQPVATNPPQVDQNDPAAFINAVIDQRMNQATQMSNQEQERVQVQYLNSKREELAQELQLLTEASESGVEPCEGQLDLQLIDNAMRFSNGAHVLRTIFSGKEGQRIKALPPIEQAREMGKYAQQLASRASVKAKSNAPAPQEYSRGSAAPVIPKSINSMSSRDFRAALRKGKI